MHSAEKQDVLPLGHVAGSHHSDIREGITVGYHNRSGQGITIGTDLLQVKFQQKLSAVDMFACPDLQSKSGSMPFHRVHSNMNQKVHAGIYTSQTDVIEQQVRAAHQQADFVIVGVHWGVEDSHTIVDGQRTLAQQLADWGADVIVGTHPHVLQDAQWLSAADGRQTFVAYSLGNFLSTQNRPDQLVGAILNLQLQKTTEPDGTVQCAVLEPKLLPTVTHYDAGKSNVRTYLFRDYTQELAKQHGVRAKHSDFSLDTVQKIAQNNISSDFLELT